MFSGAQVNLYCDDVEECAAFYRRLGCAERFRTPGEGRPSMVEVAGPGFTIGLAAAAAGTSLGLDVGPATTSPVELVFWCEDVEAAFGTALEAGGSAVREPERSPDGRLRHAWVRDPAAHLVKLVQKV